VAADDAAKPPPSGGVAARPVCAETRPENTPRLPHAGRTSVALNACFRSKSVLTGNTGRMTLRNINRRNPMSDGRPVGPTLEKIMFPYALQQINMCKGFATKSFKATLIKIPDFAISTSCARTKPLHRMFEARAYRLQISCVRIVFKSNVLKPAIKVHV